MNVNEGYEDPQKAIAEGIDPTNYALDADKAARFWTDVGSMLGPIEIQRVTIEERWNRYHHVWARKNTDSSRFYTGVNDAYFPVAFSGIETLVAYLTGALLPPGPKFAVRSENPMVPPAVLQKFTALYEYFFALADVQANLKEFVRQGTVFGPSIVKNVWRDETTRCYKPKFVPTLHPVTGQPQLHDDGSPMGTVKPVAEEIVKYRGPTFHVVDMTSIYLHPFNARKLDDCTIIFEKINRDIREIQQQEGKAYLGTQRLIDNDQANKTSGAAIRRDSNQNFRNEPYGLSTMQIHDKNQYVLNEIWCLFDLYGDGYLVPCKAVMCNDVLLELRQNPYWSQRAPYRLWRTIPHMDHIYGMGWLEIVEHHQYTLNACVNQFLDANLFQSNQMMAIDADRYQGRMADIAYAPLSVIPFSGGGNSDVRDAIYFHKPESSAQEMLAACNMIAGSLQDSMGTPPVTQGKFTNKERTATEVTAVASGASNRIDSMVDDLRLQIIQTWMEDCFELLQQFNDDGLDFKITGMPPIHMERNDVLQKPMIQVLTGPESQAWQQQQQAEQAAQAAMMPGAGGPGGDTMPGQQTPSGPSEGIGGKSFGTESGPG